MKPQNWTSLSGVERFMLIHMDQMNYSQLDVPKSDNNANSCPIHSFIS